MYIHVLYSIKLLYCTYVNVWGGEKVEKLLGLWVCTGLYIIGQRVAECECIGARWVTG